MELKQSTMTVRLIAEHLSDMGLSLPLGAEDMDTISDFFEKMEVDMANALSYGEKIDMELLDAVSKAYDEVTYVNDDDFIDMDN